MAKATVRIEQDPVIEIEIDDPETASYYVSQQIAEVVERTLAALGVEPVSSSERKHG